MMAIIGFLAVALFGAYVAFVSIQCFVAYALLSGMGGGNNKDHLWFLLPTAFGLFIIWIAFYCAPFTLTFGMAA